MPQYDRQTGKCGALVSPLWLMNKGCWNCSLSSCVIQLYLVSINTIETSSSWMHAETPCNVGMIYINTIMKIVIVYNSVKKA